MLKDFFINFSILVTLTTIGAMMAEAGPEVPRRWRQAGFQCLVTAACGLILMQYPVRLPGGVILAFHLVSPALAGLYGGPAWGGAVAVPLMIGRYLIGGDGALPGLLNILAAGVVAGLIPVGGRGFSMAWGGLAWRAAAVFAASNLAMLLIPGQGLAVFTTYFLPVSLAQSLGLMVCVAVLRTRHEAQANLRRYTNLAHADHLTGLPNGRVLEQALSQYGQLERGCLLLLDIDRFKSVNDTHGHMVGDEVLRQVAQVMRRELREGDLLCRNGGEEFAVIMARCSEQQALLVAERLRRAVAAHVVPVQRGGVSVTVSGGLVPLDPSRDIGAQFDEADRLLYQAKALGRNRILSPGMGLLHTKTGD